MLAVGRVVSSVIAVVAPVAIIRTLDQTAVGHYKQLFLISSTLVTVLGLGIPASLYFFLPRHPSVARHLLWRSTLILTVTGALGGAALLLAHPLLARQFALTDFRATAYAAVFTAVSLPIGLLPVAATADGRVATASLAIAGFDILRAAAMLSGALLFRSVDAVIAGAAGAAIVQAFVYVAYLRHRGSDAADAPEPVFAPVARAQLGYALTYYGAIVASLIREQAHSFYVAASVTPAAFAIYAVGLLQVPLIPPIAQALTDVLLVRGSELHGRGMLDDLVELWHRSSLALAIIIVPVVTGLEVFAPELFEALFGRTYIASVPIFRLWLLLLVLQIPLLHPMLRATGRTRSATTAEVLSLVAALATLPPLVALFGPVGAAVSLIIGALAFQLFGSLGLRSALMSARSPSMPWAMLLRLALIAGAVALGLRLAVITLPPLIRLAVGLPATVLGAFLLALRAGVVADEDRERLTALATGWVSAIRGVKWRGAW